ncbi:unnamed protein product [Protopolystoma xenopodis]|uniref:DOMON domain-containing protein n=1 Tax=Protopolystoma xenopodis TaxID=117903 RepID=A0A3S5CBE9_9PLAT|nr:unnamed protein product [Protopolystoma xenopodis]
MMRSSTVLLTLKILLQALPFLADTLETIHHFSLLEEENTRCQLETTSFSNQSPTWYHSSVDSQGRYTFSWRVEYDDSEISSDAIRGHEQYPEDWESRDFRRARKARSNNSESRWYRESSVEVGNRKRNRMNPRLFTSACLKFDEDNEKPLIFGIGFGPSDEPVNSDLVMLTKSSHWKGSRQTLGHPTARERIKIKKHVAIKHASVDEFNPSFDSSAVNEWILMEGRTDEKGVIQLVRHVDKSESLLTCSYSGPTQESIGQFIEGNIMNDKLWESQRSSEVMEEEKEERFRWSAKGGIFLLEQEQTSHIFFLSSFQSLLSQHEIGDHSFRPDYLLSGKKTVFDVDPNFQLLRVQLLKSTWPIPQIVESDDVKVFEMLVKNAGFPQHTSAHRCAFDSINSRTFQFVNLLVSRRQLSSGRHIHF